MPSMCRSARGRTRWRCHTGGGWSGRVLRLSGASRLCPRRLAYRGGHAFQFDGGGARAVDVQVPVPETTQSHSVLITGNSGTNPTVSAPPSSTPRAPMATSVWPCWSGATLCPSCRRWTAFSIWGKLPARGRAYSRLSCRRTCGPAIPISGVAGQVCPVRCAPGRSGLPGLQCLGPDAAADTVQNLSGQRFLMLVNVGAVDSAGQNLGADGYRQTVQALDVPLGRLAEVCRQNNVLWPSPLTTAWSFLLRLARVGTRLEVSSSPEALRVPLVFLGPGVEELNLGGRWSEVDIAPTLLGILNISSKLTRKARACPSAKGTACGSRARPRAWSCGGGKSGWPTAPRVSAASGVCRVDSTASRLAEKNGRCW